MAELHLRFAKTDTQIDNGVLTNIYPTPSKSESDSRAPKRKGVRGITIPVGSEETFRKVDVAPGNYQVECILPSGDIVTQDVEVREGVTEEVVIRSSESPHEWLRWQQMSGNISAQQLYTGRPVSDGVIDPVVKARIDQESVTVDPKLLDQSHPATQALEFGANRLWQDLVVHRTTESASRGDSAADLSRSLNFIKSLVLSGLFEIAAGSVRTQFFEPAQQWSSLEQLTGPDASQPLTDLMSRCMSAQQAATDTAGGILWFSPDVPDKETSWLRILPAGNSHIRQFLLWTPAGAELIHLPREWTDVSKHVYAPIDVMINLSGDERSFRTSVTVQDPTLSSALSYLTAGALPTAGELFERAPKMLYTKMTNPYAAAAGAYVLLATREPNDDQKWTKWIRNLHHRFRWLPDAAILYAWLNVKLGEHDVARDAFKEAFRRGVPLYCRGLKILLDGLKLFASVDEECADMQRYARRVAWRTNMQQVFTIVRLGVSSTPRK